jgi:hypothetical protein
MQDEQQELWLKLCQQAASEQDTEQFTCFCSTRTGNRRL